MKGWIKFFIWIGMLFQFFLIYPIIVGVIALKRLNEAQTKDELMGIGIAVTLLVSTLGGILMLIIKDKDLVPLR